MEVGLQQTVQGWLIRETGFMFARGGDERRSGGEERRPVTLLGGQTGRLLNMFDNAYPDKRARVKGKKSPFQVRTSINVEKDKISMH